MDDKEPDRVTLMLQAVRAGESGAEDRLFEVVYDELRRVAARRMAAERADHTLDPTGLVHELYLRLVSDRDQSFSNRLHFFSAAAESMRRILIDRGRQRRRLKRGGARKREPLDDALQGDGAGDGVDLLALDEALERLQKLDARKAEVVKLRYFLGLTIEETADLLGVTSRTVELSWRMARAWLGRELSKGDSWVPPGEET